MAYIDQDRSREKMVSGAISVAIVGAVGFGLVSGLAMSVMREPTWLTPAVQWKIPVPPPVKQPPEHKQKTTDPKTTTDPIPTPIPLPPVPGPVQRIPDPIPIPLPPIGLGGGGGGSTQLPPVDHSARATPRGDPGTWVTTDDYPPSAVRAGIEGRTSFRLDVGADGRPAGCTVITSSGSDDLDRTACRKLMGRARFKPALDSSGNPVASAYSGGVTWKLPAE